MQSLLSSLAPINLIYFTIYFLLSTCVLARIGAFWVGENRTLPNWQKFGPFRIGKSMTPPVWQTRTPPEWQNWDPSGLAKIGPFRIGKIGTPRVCKNSFSGTFENLTRDLSGYVLR